MRLVLAVAALLFGGVAVMAACVLFPLLLSLALLGHRERQSER